MEIAVIICPASSSVTTIEEMGAFWDTHDFTEYDTDAPDVPFTIARAVQIEEEEQV